MKWDCNLDHLGVKAVIPAASFIAINTSDFKKIRDAVYLYNIEVYNWK